MNIESERLIYKKIAGCDFDNVASNLRDKGVQKIWEHYFNEEDVKEWINKRLRGYYDNGIDYLLVIKKDNNEVIGLIGLLKENVNGEMMWGLGYILKSEHHGKGYATEGAKVMIDYAFNVFKC